VDLASVCGNHERASDAANGEIAEKNCQSEPDRAPRESSGAFAKKIRQHESARDRTAEHSQNDQWQILQPQRSRVRCSGQSKVHGTDQNHKRQDGRTEKYEPKRTPQQGVMPFRDFE
jgi:hypothetical protein